MWHSNPPATRRRVTFSRNHTSSLSRTCQCYCKYCAFKTHRAHLYSPEEVEVFLEQAVRRNAKELLVIRRRHDLAKTAVA